MTITKCTLAHLEDMIEALMTHIAYGQQVRSEKDLLLMVPRNQLTNLSRLVAGSAAYMEFNASSQGGPIDAGRVFRTKTFEGIDIVSVPDMTTTVLLLVHKPDVTIFRNRALSIIEKPELADTMLWQLSCGFNAICKCPGNSGKLSAKTA